MCKHDWIETNDDVMFTGEIAEAMGLMADVFCPKCGKGALLDENGKVIRGSIAETKNSKND